MICRRTRDRRCAFEDIEAILSAPRGPLDPPTVGKITGIAHPTRPNAKEIGIQADKEIGLIQTVDRLHLFAKGQLRAIVDIIAIDRLVLVPACLRELGQ